MDNVQQPQQDEELNKGGATPAPQADPPQDPPPEPNPEGDSQAADPAQEGAKPQDDPPKQEDGKSEGDKPRMTKEQVRTYNDTLRQISKSVNAETKSGYNAFADKEVQQEVKRAVLAGETPKTEDLTKTAVAKFPSPKQAAPAPESKASNEVAALRAENALIKAGVRLDRIESATKLFIAEGASVDKVADFVARFPEWSQAQAADTKPVVGKAPPVNTPTAPSNTKTPPLNEFQKKVLEIRRARGLKD